MRRGEEGEEGGEALRRGEGEEVVVGGEEEAF